MILYVSCDADDAGKLIGRARLADDVEEVRRVSARLDRGLEILKSWALSVGGSVVEAGGDECSLEIPADYVGEIPAVRDQYAEAVKCTLSVGVGMRLAESAKALYAAKLRGKDQVVFYSPECDELIEKEAKEAKEDEPEAEKLRAEYLDKAAPAMNPGAHAGFAGVTEPAAPANQQPTAAQGDHEEGQALLDMLGEDAPASPEATHAAKDYESQLHDEAWKGEEEDMKGQVDHRGRLDAVKQQVAQALQVLKVKAPILEQVRAVDPEAYKATMALVQSVIALAREAGGPEAMGKSERLAKGYGSHPRGFVSPAGEFHPVGDETDHQDWIEDRYDGSYGSALRDGWMAVGIAGDANVQAHSKHLSNPDHPATKKVREIARAWGPQFEAMKHDDSKITTDQHDTRAFVGRGALTPPSPFAKAEGVRDRVRQYTKQIQGVLSPDLLKPEYAGSKHCLAGHCYVAAESLYHLLGGAEAGWTPQVVQHEGGPHWFLRHASGRIADPTAAQFSTPPPYGRAQGKGFLTYPVPSERARQVMERMLTEQSLRPEDAAGIAGEKPLVKMAIADIRRGRKLRVPPGQEKYDYRHVLTGAQKQGYTVHVERRPVGPGEAPTNSWMSVLSDSKGQPVGSLGFRHHPEKREIRVSHALIDSSHRGKGLGVPMYEAAYAHARHALGASHVVGEEHSTSANRVHESLSRKHGMFYEPHDTTGEGDDQEEDFDGRFNGYRYAIKSEEQADSLSKAVKPAAQKPLTAPPASAREELVHYSVKPGLKAIGVDHMGTGAPGAEYKQGIPEVGRAYYYRAGSQPEPLVTQGAKERYTAHLDPAKHRLYDLGTDPEGLRAPSRERFLAGEGLETPEDTFLDTVRSRGYYGYHNSASAMPHVVALFHAHPVSKGEDLDKTSTPRLPPQPVGASIAQAPAGAAGSAAAVNKIKVQHSDGTTGIKQVEAGVIRSMDPSEHGTSSRTPNSK